jgi:heme a synthase
MSRPSFTMSLRRFRQVAIVTVVGLCLLVVAGGVVRLTGSGLGCDDWPRCNSERFVDVSSGHTAIEQINRLLSGVIGVPTLVLAVGAFRVRPHRRGLVGPSLGVLVTVLGNAVVGGLAVLGDLHPALIQSHFLLAMVSIMFALIAAHRARPIATDVATEPVPPIVRALLGAVGLLTVAALTTGTVVTGTGPHAGDENARRWGFDISNVARLHGVTVLVTVAAALALAVALRQRSELQRRLSGPMSTWMFLAIVQGGIGYVQYFNGVPEILVGTHIAGATALWVATVQLVLSGTPAAHPVDTGIHAAETAEGNRMAIGRAQPA